jgi:hypothetical protein
LIAIAHARTCIQLQPTAARAAAERSFRGSVSGMGFAYCDFRHQGAAQMLMARTVARPRSLHPPERTGSVEVSSRVETPRVESARIEPVKSETRSEPARSDSAPELRRSTG